MKRQRGVSAIELLIAVIVLAIIVVIAIPSLVRTRIRVDYSREFSFAPGTGAALCTVYVEKRQHELDNLEALALNDRIEFGRSMKTTSPDQAEEVLQNIRLERAILDARIARAHAEAARTRRLAQTFPCKN